MKVLERKEWTRTVTCKECGSKLEISLDDLKCTRSGVEESGSPVTVTCPVCEGVIGLPHAEIGHQGWAYAITHGRTE
jgi:hypothetical protein